jgi:hypothetical protein
MSPCSASMSSRLETNELTGSRTTASSSTLASVDHDGGEAVPTLSLLLVLVLLLLLQRVGAVAARGGRQCAGRLSQ